MRSLARALQKRNPVAERVAMCWRLALALPALAAGSDDAPAPSVARLASTGAPCAGVLQWRLVLVSRPVQRLLGHRHGVATRSAPKAVANAGPALATPRVIVVVVLLAVLRPQRRTWRTAAGPMTPRFCARPPQLLLIIYVVAQIQ